MTEDCIAEVAHHPDLKKALGKQLPRKNYHVIDAPSDLIPSINDTLLCNDVNPTECIVKVGKVGLR